MAGILSFFLFNPPIILMMTQTGEAHRLPVLKERHLPGECRQSVTELLKETYGYDGFRKS